MKRSLGRSASPIAATVVLAALLTSACAAGQNAASATPASTPQASPTPAASAAAASATASTSASPTAAPLTWTQASLEEDWPAPVRTEPAGPATVVPVFWMARSTGIRRATPSPGAFPWVDIHGVGFWSQQRRRGLRPGGAGSGSNRTVDRLRARRRRPTATASRTGGSGWTTSQGPRRMLPHRAWITDLHTGRTESSVPELA